MVSPFSSHFFQFSRLTDVNIAPWNRFLCPVPDFARPGSCFALQNTKSAVAGLPMATDAWVEKVAKRAANLYYYLYYCGGEVVRG